MILILTQCFPSRIGGVESLISNLAIELSNTEKVTVFADSISLINDKIFDNKYKNNFLVKRESGIKFFRKRKKLNSVKKFIETKNVKFILADSWKSLELGVDFFNNKNIPMICLAHGNEIFINSSKKKIRIKNTFDKVTYIVANSIYTKNLVKKLINPFAPIHVINPGAQDLRNIQSSIIENINGDPVILTLARLEKRKGHAYIINAIKKLIIKFPNLKYIIAGEGTEKKNLKKLVLKYNLKKNIIFVGSVNESQKKFLFEKTDIMIMPTLDESVNRSIEGFGIVYLEAAFFSIPSVASNVGGVPEAVIHNSTGIIIDDLNYLHDTLINLLSDKDKIIFLGKNAQVRVVNNFTWAEIIKKYLSLINKYN